MATAAAAAKNGSAAGTEHPIPESTLPSSLSLPAQFFAPAKRLPPDIEKILQAPLPPQATAEDHPRLEGFSCIEPAFVVKRLHEAFGLGGVRTAYRKSAESHKKTVVWKKGTPEERTEELWVSAIHAAFYVPEYGIYGEAFGGSENVDRSDAEKGGCSDALKRWAYHAFGVGIEVYLSGKKSLTCPVCGKKLRKSKYEEDEYYCWKDKGGCGSKFTQAQLKQAKQAAGDRQQNEATGNRQQATAEKPTAQEQRRSPQSSAGGDRVPSSPRDAQLARDKEPAGAKAPSSTQAKVPTPKGVGFHQPKPASSFPKQFALACERGGKDDHEVKRYLSYLGFADPGQVPPARYNELMGWAHAS